MSKVIVGHGGRLGLAIAGVLAAAGHEVVRANPFAALERRTLTREEALEAFKPTEADLEAIRRAEEKRQRKAAKLRSA